MAEVELCILENKSIKARSLTRRDMESVAKNIRLVMYSKVNGLII